MTPFFKFTFVSKREREGKRKDSFMNERGRFATSVVSPEILPAREINRGVRVGEKELEQEEDRWRRRRLSSLYHRQGRSRDT